MTKFFPKQIVWTAIGASAAFFPISVYADNLTWDKGYPGGGGISNGDGAWNNENEPKVWRNDRSGKEDRFSNDDDSVTFAPADSSGPPYAPPFVTVTVEGEVRPKEITFARDPLNSVAFTIASSNANAAIIQPDSPNPLNINMFDDAIIAVALRGQFAILGDKRLTYSGVSGSSNTRISIGDANSNRSPAVVIQNGGAIAGSIDNNTGTLTVENGATVNSVINNSTTNVSGTVNTIIQNGGVVTLGNGASITKLTNNAETVVADGASAEVKNQITNNRDGTLTVDGSLDANAGVSNEGTVNVNQGGSLNGSITNAPNGAVEVDQGGRVQGNITNSQGGTVRINGSTTNGIENGTLYGSLTNEGSAIVSGTVATITQNGGEVELSGSASIGTLNNNAQTTVTSGASATITNAVANNRGGTLTVEGGLTANAGINNAAGANVVINQDGNLTGDVKNNPGNPTGLAGMITVDGTLDGKLTNEGTATISGSVTTIEQNGGIVTLSGKADVTTLTNNAQTTVTAGAEATITNEVANAQGGRLTVNGDLTANSGINNATGANVVVTQGGSLTGGVTNSAGATVVINDSGTLTGDVTNSGQDPNNNNGPIGVITVDGTLDGKLTNDGTATISGTVTNVEHNNGDINLQDGAQISNTLTNNEEVEISQGRTVTIGTTENNSKLDIDGILIGTVKNSGTTNIAGTGSVTNVEHNSGDLNLESGARITDTLTNNEVVEVSRGDRVNIKTTINTGNASLTVSGDLRGTVENSGNMVVSGEDTSVDPNLPAGAVSVINHRAGDLDLGDEARVGQLNNYEEVEIVQGRTVQIRNTLNDSSGTFKVNGTLNGSLTNHGATVVTGTSTGKITNGNGDDVITGEVLTLSQEAKVNGGISNTGRIIVDASTGSGNGATVGQEIDNSRRGVVVIEDDAILTSSFLRNSSATSSLEIYGTFNGQIDNKGSARIEGGTVGGVFNGESGKINLYGNSNVSGAFSNRGDVFVNSGNSKISGAFSNDGNVFINNGAIVTVDNLSNASNVFLSGTIDGKLTNDSTLFVDGNARIAGGMDGGNNSAIYMQETPRSNSGNDTLKIEGDSNLGNTTIYMDADLSGATGYADSIDASGNKISGDLSFSFNNIAGDVYGALGSGGLTVFKFGSQSDFTIDNISGLGDRGGLLFVLEESDTDLKITTGQNPAAGALSSSITLTQSLIGSVINRPSSPLITGRASADNDPCAPGIWGRAIGGKADARGVTSSVMSTGTRIDYDSEISATYSGLQFGGDFSCFDGRFGGWSMSFGGIGGVNIGETMQPVLPIDKQGNVIPGAAISRTSTDFTQTYVGTYLSAVKGNLLVDLQYRLEQTEFEMSNSARGANRIGIIDQTFESKAHTLSGSLSYVFPLNTERRINFVPKVGFAYTQTKTDPIAFEGGDTLEIDDATTEVGFIGGSISMTNIRPSQRSAVTYFGTATIYKDFADPTRSVLYSSDRSVQAESYSSNLGEYGEFSLGLNYTRLLSGNSGRQVSASLRVDGRSGDVVDGWGVTGQIRFQF